MTQYNEGPTKAFPTGGALGQFLRVKTPTSLALAGATDVELGTMEEPAFASGEHGTVRLRTAGGTVKMVAASAITAGVAVYAAASGKVDDNGSIVIGTAVTAASGDNSVIEVLRHADVGQAFSSQEVTPDDSESVLNTIQPSANAVDVQAVTNDADDFIVLPALEDVEVGHQVMILCNAGTDFELRTPADSDEEINSENCDGTKEYLCTDTEVLRVIKISDTIGWMANAWSAIGTAVTAVVPD